MAKKPFKPAPTHVGYRGYVIRRDLDSGAMWVTDGSGKDINLSGPIFSWDEGKVWIDGEIGDG